MVELLVSMAITSMIMLALLALVGQSSTSYTQTQRAVNTLSQARAFMQFFDREISTRLPNTPLIYESPSSGGPGSSAKIAFVRAIPAEEQTAATPGDLNTSAYYVAFTADGNSITSPKLFRKTLNPNDTQALIDTAGTPPFPTVNPASDEPILNNILSFEANPKKRNPTSGKLEDWTPSSADAIAAIVLIVRFIDDSSAQRFRTESTWNQLATAPRDSELQLIRNFTRTIAIAK
ncbi:MAG: hypothetical protein H7Y36_09220 [Armatimonadetes bacterium]|nr:hypothetical protein [Akkermansiaceae bacterium]